MKDSVKSHDRVVNSPLQIIIRDVSPQISQMEIEVPSMPLSIRSTYSTRLASSRGDLHKVKKVLVSFPPLYLLLHRTCLPLTHTVAIYQLIQHYPSSAILNANHNAQNSSVASPPTTTIQRFQITLTRIIKVKGRDC